MSPHKLIISTFQMSNLYEPISGTRSKKLETTDVLNEDEEEPRHQGLSDSADVIRQHGSDVGILLLSLTTVVVSNISR